MSDQPVAEHKCGTAPLTWGACSPQTHRDGGRMVVMGAVEGEWRAGGNGDRVGIREG